MYYYYYIIAQHFDSVYLTDDMSFVQFKLTSITIPKHAVEFTVSLFIIFYIIYNQI